MLRFVFPFIGVLIACPVISQKILFTYDEAGNRISRFVETTLPVRLVYFGVTAEENAVTIRWQTAEEENVSHFDLERSSDGLSWTRIAEVHSRPQEDTSSPGYIYVDDDPPPGRNLYRLKIVDDDGTLAYSKLESVFLRSEIRFYPNPVRDYLLVDYPSRTEASYEIFSSEGRTVLRGRLTQENRIDLGALSSGLYVIRLVLDSGQVFTRRIIKE